VSIPRLRHSGKQLKLQSASISREVNGVLHTICSSCMNPGHPFAREGQYNIAILELRSHSCPRRFSHPNECLPKDPETKAQWQRGLARGREWRNSSNSRVEGIIGYHHTPSHRHSRELFSASSAHYGVCFHQGGSVNLLLVSHFQACVHQSQIFLAYFLIYNIPCFFLDFLVVFLEFWQTLLLLISTSGSRQISIS